MPSWKHVATVAAAAVVTMYLIRYLRASNSFVQTLYPQPQTASA